MSEQSSQCKVAQSTACLGPLTGTTNWTIFETIELDDRLDIELFDGLLGSWNSIRSFLAKTQALGIEASWQILLTSVYHDRAARTGSPKSPELLVVVVQK